ncbi:MAG: hemerythrin family protein [Phycisphaerae bacterium]
MGDPQLDAQHAFLFQLLDVAEQKPSMDPVEVASIVKAMLLYCRVHFTYEEAMMLAEGFPRLAEHVADHQRIVSRCMDLANRVGSGSRPGRPVIAGGLTQPLIVETLRAWLRDHIMGRGIGDACFVSWLKRGKTDL